MLALALIGADRRRLSIGSDGLSPLGPLPPPAYRPYHAGRGVAGGDSIFKADSHDPVFLYPRLSRGGIRDRFR